MYVFVFHSFHTIDLKFLFKSAFHLFICFNLENMNLTLTFGYIMIMWQ